MSDETIFHSLARNSLVYLDSESYSNSAAEQSMDLISIDMSVPDLPAIQPLETIFQPKRPYKYKNIVLDMDGTLLDNIPIGFPENPTPFETSPIARPYLMEFMEFVFDHFERVSIWTAAMPIWYEKCYKRVLRHCIPDGKSFHFVKTRLPGELYVVLKPLSEIYANYAAYNSENTLVVDDNPMTYRDNPENAIAVKSFFYDQLSREQRANLKETDNDLLLAIEEIRIRLAGM